MIHKQWILVPGYYSSLRVCGLEWRRRITAAAAAATVPVAHSVYGDVNMVCLTYFVYYLYYYVSWQNCHWRICDSPYLTYLSSVVYVPISVVCAFDAFISQMGFFSIKIRWHWDKYQFPGHLTRLCVQSTYFQVCRCQAYSTCVHGSEWHDGISPR